jgi:hypothetical protein
MLIVLDVMLPGVDGFEVLKRLPPRAQSSCLLAAERLIGLLLCTPQRRRFRPVGGNHQRQPQRRPLRFIGRDPVRFLLHQGHQGRFGGEGDGADGSRERPQWRAGHQLQSHGRADQPQSRRGGTGPRPTVPRIGTTAGPPLICTSCTELPATMPPPLSNTPLAGVSRTSTIPRPSNPVPSPSLVISHQCRDSPLPPRGRSWSAATPIPTRRC